MTHSIRYQLGLLVDDSIGGFSQSGTQNHSSSNGKSTKKNVASTSAYIDSSQSSSCESENSDSRDLYDSHTFIKPKPKANTRSQSTRIANSSNCNQGEIGNAEPQEQVFMVKELILDVIVLSVEPLQSSNSSNLGKPNTARSKSTITSITLDVGQPVHKVNNILEVSSCESVVVTVVHFPRYVIDDQNKLSIIAVDDTFSLDEVRAAALNSIVGCRADLKDKISIRSKLYYRATSNKKEVSKDHLLSSTEQLLGLIQKSKVEKGCVKVILSFGLQKFRTIKPPPLDLRYLKSLVKDNDEKFLFTDSRFGLDEFKSNSDLESVSRTGAWANVETNIIEDLYSGSICFDSPEVKESSAAASSKQSRENSSLVDRFLLYLNTKDVPQNLYHHSITDQMASVWKDQLLLTHSGPNAVRRIDHEISDESDIDFSKLKSDGLIPDFEAPISWKNNIGRPPYHPQRDQHKPNTDGTYCSHPKADNSNNAMPEQTVGQSFNALVTCIIPHLPAILARLTNPGNTSSNNNDSSESKEQVFFERSCKNDDQSELLSLSVDTCIGVNYVKNCSIIEHLQTMSVNDNRKMTYIPDELIGTPDSDSGLKCTSEMFELIFFIQVRNHSSSPKFIRLNTTKARERNSMDELMENDSLQHPLVICVDMFYKPEYDPNNPENDQDDEHTSKRPKYFQF